MNSQEWKETQGTQTAETREILLAAREKDQWHFTNRTTSSLFAYTMTDTWNLRVYEPYYKDFWQELHDRLDTCMGVQEITLDAEYTFGVETEGELRNMMEHWRKNRKGSSFLTVTRQESGDNVAFSKLTIKDIHVVGVDLE